MIAPALLTRARAAVVSLMGETCTVIAPVRSVTDGDWIDTFDPETGVSTICDVQTGSGVKSEGRDRELAMLRTAFYFPVGTVVKSGYRIRRDRDGAMYAVMGPADEQTDDLALEVFANLIEEVA